MTAHHARRAPHTRHVATECTTTTPTTRAPASRWVLTRSEPYTPTFKRIRTLQRRARAIWRVAVQQRPAVETTATVEVTVVGAHTCRPRRHRLVVHRGAALLSIRGQCDRRSHRLRRQRLLPPRCLASAGQGSHRSSFSWRLPPPPRNLPTARRCAPRDARHRPSAATVLAQPHHTLCLPRRGRRHQSPSARNSHSAEIPR